MSSSVENYAILRLVVVSIFTAYATAVDSNFTILVADLTSLVIHYSSVKTDSNRVSGKFQT